MVFQDMFTKIRMKRDAEGIHTDEKVDGLIVTRKRNIIMETTSRLGKHLYFLLERSVGKIST